MELSECVPDGHILEAQKVEERDSQHSPGFLLIPFLSQLNLSGNIFTDMLSVVSPR